MDTAADVAIIIVAAGFLTMMTVAALVTWRMIRRFRIWRDRVKVALPQRWQSPTPETMATAMSSAHRSSLGARALVGRGARRQALWLRRDLWTHMDASTSAVNAAQATGVPVGDLPYLLGHLRDQARRHDHALVLVSKGIVALPLADAQMETVRITNQADMVAKAVVDAMRTDSLMHPDHLATALDHEARSVADGSARVRSLTVH